MLLKLIIIKYFEGFNMQMDGCKFSNSLINFFWGYVYKVIQSINTWKCG